jgi:hypothetical protein
MVVLACGQLSVQVLTPTPESLVGEVLSEGGETPSPTVVALAAPSATPSTTPTPEPSPTSEWSQYWVTVEDPYHQGFRFAMPCFWLSQFPDQDHRGDGAFAYPVKNYPEEYVLNFPRSVIPPEAGAIKIDMNFMSPAMWNLPPGSSQLEFVEALYGGDTETTLISTEEVEINAQPALYVVTESTFGTGNFYLLTYSEDLFLAFSPPYELADHPDVLGILSSLAMTPEVEVQVPEHKPAPPPTGLAAPCIPGYEQAVEPTVEVREGNTACGLSSFIGLESLVGAVQDKLIARDYGSLNYDHYINDPFIIGYWGSEGVTLTPMDTATQLANNLLPPTAFGLTFTTDRNAFPPLAGMPPENMFGPNLKVARIVYSEGWGADGQGAALLYFAEDQCGGYYWYGLVVSFEHFDK